MTKSRFKDAELKDRVTWELTTDAVVDVADVGVEAQQGVVTLSGLVDSSAKRVAAVQAAHRVQGVLDVADEIMVQRDDANLRDTEVAQAVRRELRRLVSGRRGELKTTVSGGFVVIEGEVTSWAQRDAAERAVKHLPGVCGVTNNIAVDRAV